MAKVYGIYLFQQVAALDFVGPADVFSLSNMLHNGGRVVTIAESTAPVVCANGMTITPDYDFSSAPELDVLLIPGAEQLDDAMGSPAALEWITQQADQVAFVAAVCTGALIIQKAGLLVDKKATTHWQLLEQLAADERTRVMPEMRYVRDGQVITAQGISAGIDMALWLVGELYTPDHARMVRKILQYDPAPPYTAEV